MNFKMVLSYDGTDFYGWQYQPDRRTVSGELIRVLNRLIDGSYRLVGVGRTDAGVHALNYVANVRVEGRLRVSEDDLAYKLNRMLPSDIYVKSIEKVSEDFHARYSAISKTYRYLFGRGYDPLNRHRVWYVPVQLHPPNLNRVFKVLVGKHDFARFSADERDNTVCEVMDITFGYTGKFTFMDVRADRFLRKMVRFFAGLAVSVAGGLASENDILSALKGGRRIKNLTPAPPWGLYLFKVDYPRR
ncbi:MAG: tRNA pseudouridine(38-40) synthase TruA [Thermotogae bacterium]|nr:tRNA pseudouridine(38-40) synthase TruA [Thermotogota bacterium]